MTRPYVPLAALPAGALAVESAVPTGGVADRGIPDVRSWMPRVVQRGRLARE